MKKIIIHLRTSIKFISLVIISCFLIVGMVAFIYKPTYNVLLDGQTIGYSENKSKLQQQINEYIENGETEHTAFVQVDNLPEYKLCLLKKDITPNDEEIYEKIKETGTEYYRYYAISQDGEEKIYVATFEEAEQTVNSLKEKNSTNKDTITISEKYETELEELVTSEQAISKLYVEPEKTKTVASNSTKAKSTGTFPSSSGANTSNQKVSVGIAFIKPIQGSISSRYGSRWGTTHKGLDISAPHGTPIKAAASGTVTYSGWKGGYGNLIIVSHGNGTQTYYGHCSSLVATAGQQVEQGQVIAKVGSTGDSTGNHLHLEVRVNGVAQNPQNYVY